MGLKRIPWRHILTRRRVLVILTAAFMFVLFTAAVYAWEYTSTPKFCGTTCHTMPVEYTSYQRSAHARVDCVNCHLARGVNSAVPQKASEVRHVFNQLTSRYENPVVTKSLRPARDVCERCHWPEKFYGDKIREVKSYATDETNTETRTYLVMKTRGGIAREGVGQSMGIHWHVSALVSYISTDLMKQTIPWVSVQYPDGRTIEYLSEDSTLTEQDIAQATKRTMDCIDCHNRASHLIRSPETSLDNMLATNLIDRGIPLIKKKGIEVLSAEYKDAKAAIAAIASLDDFYRTTYPQVYVQRRESIATAIAQLKETYELIYFPQREVDWETYPNNVGHKEFPGCFRCHDGRHIATDRTVPPELLSIRLQCNICHSIPSTIGERERPPMLPASQVLEPVSHARGDWMAQHPKQVSKDCTVCHGELLYSAKPKVSEQSFCANVACHGTGWAKYVELIEVPAPAGATPQPTPTPTRATTVPTVAPAVPSTPVPATPATPAPSATPAASGGGIPNIRHPLDGRNDCLMCHDSGRLKPFPANHKGRTNDSCLVCHQPSK